MGQKKNLSKSSSDENEFDILPFIPVGYRNAVTRAELRRRTGKNDRVIRDAIADARHDMPIVNVQNGKGYFIPDENDPEDVRLLRLFVIQEEHRLKSIGWSLKGARKALRNYDEQRIGYEKRAHYKKNTSVGSNSRRITVF